MGITSTKEKQIEGAYDNIWKDVEKMVNDFKKAQDKPKFFASNLGNVKLMSRLRKLDKLYKENKTEEFNKERTKLDDELSKTALGKIGKNLLNAIFPPTKQDEDNLGLKNTAKQYFNDDGSLKGNTDDERKKNLLFVLRNAIIRPIYLLSKTMKNMKYEHLKKIIGQAELNRIETEMKQTGMYDIIEQNIKENNIKEGGVVDIAAIVLIVGVVLIYCISIIATVVVILATLIAIIVIVAMVLVTIIILAVIIAIVVIYIVATIPIILYIMKDGDKINERQADFMDKYLNTYEIIIDNVFGTLSKALDTTDTIKNLATVATTSITDLGKIYVSGAFNALSQYINFTSLITSSSTSLPSYSNNQQTSKVITPGQAATNQNNNPSIQSITPITQEKTNNRSNNNNSNNSNTDELSTNIDNYRLQTEKLNALSLSTLDNLNELNDSNNTNNLSSTVTNV
ncbi:MAG: hypothetical protein KIT69_15215, partial [Propionibacteriaceae bacterium]|nr:hypothetical protein [Propionibacteriaceae bacterium]